MNQLTEKEKYVIIDKGTERPFSGKYYNFDEKGIFLCKQCGAQLFISKDKFHSGCGWPSFDDAIKGAVKRVKDADGKRTEIICARCGAHLGHVFEGEGFTAKDTRYCVNSISLNFQKDFANNLKKAYFAGGCFWGVEYYLEKQKGVLSVVSGYMGGKKPNPSYRDVSRGDSGYFETVEVTYDPKLVDYETLAKLFFEIHDPTQKNGQGPDIGSQYHSAIFVSNIQERNIIKKLIRVLKLKGYDVATVIRDKKEFYKAEEYHQNYYDRKGKKPYCHGYVKRF
ncbi:bifunctional methionine sulfoxide reductase B/A protein [Sulfurimonas sp. C5]|uniref:bifunctional methionine sulfoxide reductase B/A protein n=1 Tax=Sulfurimonas sp. C5 TaxID=3036947 RepID=UPI0024574767|nr:bifunctional methionine sulfoxide reductase B/A protein [Sulfurimonas sp. C5]MDH4943465.1 bifunctional methionine sulfoxide reductase B/A protein [Sulfurimonas sp. C5]